MAEIAGTTVGIISLSIQICQGLVTYIDGVKHAKSKAEQVVAEMDRLADQLENLESVISKVDPSQSTVLTRESITACAGAIGLVREKVKVYQPTGETGLRANFKSLGRKLVFPFIEADVEYWKSVVGSIQQSLQIALDTLTLDLRMIDSQATKEYIQNLSQEYQAQFWSLRQHQSDVQESTTRLLISQHEFVASNLSSTREYLGIIHDDTRLIRDAITPLATHTSYLNNFSTISDRLASIEAQLGRRCLGPETMSAIQSDVTELRSLRRDFNRSSRQFHRSGLKCLCGLRSRRSTTTYLCKSWMSASSYHMSSHESFCPWSAVDQARSGIALRWNASNFILRKRAEISLSIATGRGFRIEYALRFYRIVDKRSPAFDLLDRHALELYCGNITAKEVLLGLSKLFQSRQASPYDRLSDGRTIFHLILDANRYLIETSESTILLRTILQSWPDLATQLDDNGMSGADEAIEWYSHRQDVSNAWCEIAPIFWEFDVPIGNTNLSNWSRVYSNTWLDTLPKVLPASFMDLKECYQVVLQKDEAHLQKLLLETSQGQSLEVGDYLRMLRISTRTGWIAGCRLLESHGLSESEISVAKETDSTLLRLAIVLGDRDMLRFWLRRREYWASRQLEIIGHYASSLNNDYYSQTTVIPEFLEEVLRQYVVQQRTQLREMLDLHSIRNPCSGAPEYLLDAHAPCAVQALTDQGIEVPMFLRPGARSIYEIATGCRRPQRSTTQLDKWYEAGFRSVTTVDFACDRQEAYSLSIFYALRTGYPCFDLDWGVVEWFLSKGVSKLERYPDSDTSLVHCLGWSCGIKHRRFSPYTLTSWFLDCHKDGCDCPCSEGGCTFLTMFLNIISLSYYHLDNHEHIPDMFMENLFEFGQDFERRWIITSFLRIWLFNALGLRHTCCDLDRITHDGTLDITKQPLPQYPPALAARIDREDAELRELLQELVPKFDAAYDDFKGNLGSFVWDYLKPEMQNILQDLAKKDKKEFEAGRRELGVIMDYGEISEGDVDEQADEAEVEEVYNSDEDY